MKIVFKPEKSVSDISTFCGLKIWKMPEVTRAYAIGADVAEGVGKDASVAQIIDVDNGLHVASFWHSYLDPDHFGSELYKLGLFFNKAYICVEANSIGSTVITRLTGALGGLGYPNLYKRWTFDEYTQKKTKIVGFKTTSSTKPRIIENLKAAFRDGDTVTHDRQMIYEMNMFVKDQKTGRMGAQGSGHDDRVMAYALAWEQTKILKETSPTKTESSSYDGGPYSLL